MDVDTPEVEEGIKMHHKLDALRDHNKGDDGDGTPFYLFAKRTNVMGNRVERYVATAYARRIRPHCHIMSQSR
ncbi:hypothetical protein BD779DRAFT_1563707 [Infundibulicybe gibba]|nr:hypothetical protein BD779DRAFT_1563707 [Infundibulicybe gibba]